MTVFKCKMCGGNLNVGDGAAVGTCQHCGSTMTLPRLDSDWRENLYDRAGHFRRAGEFDKAMALYERILERDKTDAEAYWSLVLCRYGVEYVEDPKTGRHIPTCNRTQASSIFGDADYKAALQYATPEAKALYEAEARLLDEVLKGILDISAREEPFDVFICYKESDDRGGRTPDSVLAQELYTLLAKEGFKVFFSRITLEDKLGIEYEPYIYAALNSARVMVAVGTKAEYFQSAWVRNEWSRYLALIRAGEQKTLIPAYRDMDPYDLPEEFSHLQAQDMGKLGFMQDLLRGIQKLLGRDNRQASAPGAAENQVTATAASIFKRAMFNISEGGWAKADDLLEQALNIDHEFAPAYLGKLLCELQLTEEDQLAQHKEPLEEVALFKRALRFADGAYRPRLEELMRANETHRKEPLYQEALKMMENKRFEAAKKKLKALEGYRDSEAQIECCEEALRAIAYQEAKAYMAEERYREAARILNKLEGCRDSDQLLQQALDAQAEQERQKEEQRRLAREQELKERQRMKRITWMVAGTVALLLGILALAASVASNRRAEQYQQEMIVRVQSALAGEDYGEIRAIYVDLRRTKVISESTADQIRYQVVDMLVAELRKTLAQQDIERICTLYKLIEYPGSYTWTVTDVRSEAKSQAVAQMSDYLLQNMEEGELEELQSVFAVAKRELDEATAAIVGQTIDRRQTEPYYTHAEALVESGNPHLALGYYARLADDPNYPDAAEKYRLLYGSLHAVDAYNGSSNNNYYMGLLQDNTLVINESIRKELESEEFETVVAVACNYSIALVLFEDGSVRSLLGLKESDLYGWDNIIAIAADSRHAIALSADGSVHGAATISREKEAVQVDDWSDIVAIGTGYDFSAGLTAGGTLKTTRAFSNTDYADASVKLTALFTGYNRIVALGEDGTIYQWCDGTLFDLNYDASTWNQVVSFGVGRDFLVGLRGDGTVLLAGNQELSLELAEWTDIVAVCAARDYVFGITADGGIHVAGGNAFRNGLALIEGFKTPIRSWDEYFAQHPKEESPDPLPDQ